MEEIMTDLKGTRTEKNLQEAFAGESQANRKYLAFAKQAEKEGYSQVAKLFRAAAEAETIHAHNHLRVLGGINSTAENLQEAIEGESHEFKNMYPDMIEHAQEEGIKAGERTFRYANDVEKVHAQIIYVDQGERLKMDFHKPVEESLQEYWDERAGKLRSDDSFSPRPNPGCRWCHFRKSNGGPCIFG